MNFLEKKKKKKNERKEKKRKEKLSPYESQNLVMPL